MIAAAALVAGFGVSWLLCVLLDGVLQSEVFARLNYRGRRVATAAGVVAVLAVLAVEAARVLLGRLGVGTDVVTVGRTTTVIVVVGFGLLGLIDDLAGSEDRGFRGHLRALRHGSLTTGGLKLVGGGLVAAVVASFTAPKGIAELLLDAMVIALAANLANLLDRAPGRAIKVGAAAFAGVALTGSFTLLVGPAVAVGACLALARADLRERIMLGDTGANVLGAAIGLGAVLVAGTAMTALIAGALLALNLVSEAVSFSRVIDRVPPLRFLDQLGREPGP